MYSLYLEKKFAEAYSVTEEMMEKFPEKAGIIYSYAYSTKNMAGDSQGALDLMEEAAEKGYWADPDMLQEDPDLLTLRENPRFNAVLKKYASLAAESKKSQKPLLKVIEPKKNSADPSDPMPLLIALHGNNESAEDSMEIWKFMAEKGWLVALPQSSQTSMPGAYVWNEASVAIPEVRAHYDELKSKYRIDADKTVIAGFSMGGALAARLCLRQLVPCRRFVLMGPYLKKTTDLGEMVKIFSSVKGKGYLVVGEDDAECIDETKSLYDMLTSNGIDCRIDIISGLGHEYPEGFEEMIGKNMEFLLEKLP